jgi:hypothetical protein
MAMSSSLIRREEVTAFQLEVKGGQKRFPFIVAQKMHTRQNSFLPPDEWSRWDSLSFTTIPYGVASGKSFPEFFCVKHPNRILWWGNAASFEEKCVLMVVYFNAEMGCIAHACYLIQLHEPTFLTPSLYVTTSESYKSFTILRVQNNHFNGQKIQADRFEIDRYYGSKPLERNVRLSNDNGETWSKFKLTFSLETMTPVLTLIPSDQKP